MHDERLERHLILLDSDRRHLVRAASRLLGADEAQDAVQDAYLRALEAECLDLNVAQAWLLTVVRHLAIDRLRRRQWMAQWLAQTHTGAATHTVPSAERDVALAQEVIHALQRLAAHLSPCDGAAVLLLEVFEASHAELAEASGKSEAASRQQLRRALLRLRQVSTQDASELGTQSEDESQRETAFRQYLHALQLRDPHTLWVMLCQRPISARAGAPTANLTASPAPQGVTSAIVQVGGQLGLVLTLDGVRLCVVPLGVQTECDRQPSLL